MYKALWDLGHPPLSLSLLPSPYFPHPAPVFKCSYWPQRLHILLSVVWNPLHSLFWVILNILQASLTPHSTGRLPDMSLFPRAAQISPEGLSSHPTFLHSNTYQDCDYTVLIKACWSSLHHDCCQYRFLLKLGRAWGQPS